MMNTIESFDLGEPNPAECPECGAAFSRTFHRLELKGEFLGYFPVDRCPNGHEYLTQESSEAINAVAKERGLWGWERPRTVATNSDTVENELLSATTTSYRERRTESSENYDSCTTVVGDTRTPPRALKRLTARV